MMAHREETLPCLISGSVIMCSFSYVFYLHRSTHNEMEKNRYVKRSLCLFLCSQSIKNSSSHHPSVSMKSVNDGCRSKICELKVIVIWRPILPRTTKKTESWEKKNGHWKWKWIRTFERQNELLRWISLVCIFPYVFPPLHLPIVIFSLVFRCM